MKRKPKKAKWIRDLEAKGYTVEHAEIYSLPQSFPLEVRMVMSVVHSPEEALVRLKQERDRIIHGRNRSTRKNILYYEKQLAEMRKDLAESLAFAEEIKKAINFINRQREGEGT